LRAFASFFGPGLRRQRPELGVICATPHVQLEDLDRFATEVIPAFRDAKTAVAAE